MRLTALAVVSLAIGCGGAPDNPTWTEDVKPILQANCIKCHGSVTRGGAPADFRLDVYDSAVTRGDGRFIRGALSMARFIKERTHAETMPPVVALNGVQIDTLANWFDTAEGGLIPAFGDPVASNRDPEITLGRSLDQSLDSQGFLAVEYVLSDPDFDVVTGILRAVPTGGGNVINIPGELYSGRGAVAFDAAAAPEGTYDLVAELFDGNSPILEGGVEVTLATYEVVHDQGNSAPIIAIGGPQPDALFPVPPRSDDPTSGSNEINFSVTDADDDTVDVVITAERGAEVVDIATITDVSLGDPQTVTFDPAASMAGGDWTIRIEASDPMLTRSATIDRLVMTSGPQTTIDFETVQGVLSANCFGCHQGDSFAFDAGLAIDSLDNVRITYGGVIYRRVVLEQSMPARSIDLVLDRPQMSQADRDLIAEWILGGAPQ